MSRPLSTKNSSTPRPDSPSRVSPMKCPTSTRMMERPRQPSKWAMRSLCTCSGLDVTRPSMGPAEFCVIARADWTFTLEATSVVAACSEPDRPAARRGCRTAGVSPAVLFRKNPQTTQTISRAKRARLRDLHCALSADSKKLRAGRRQRRLSSAPSSLAAPQADTLSRASGEHPEALRRERPRRAHAQRRGDLERLRLRWPLHARAR